MADKRSERRPNVVQFLSRLDRDRQANLRSLVEKAKLMEMEGLESRVWEEPLWLIKGGRLLKHPGKNNQEVTLAFSYSPKLGSGPLVGDGAEVARALMVLRFHRNQQALENQRNFITAVGYVAYELERKRLGLHQLTPEVLDAACRRASQHYSTGVAYNMHKAINEFAAHCDANRLCNVFLDYKYSGMRRPENTGGLNHKRLDDPETLETKHDKLVDSRVYKGLGELYKNVPGDHKYRFYILVFILLAWLGRRFSEIALLPCQKVRRDEEGRSYLMYFPRKQTKGDVFTPTRRLYLPTEIVPIVEPVIDELEKLCSSARETAAEMEMANGPDLAFLLGVGDDERFYKRDLELIGIPSQVLLANRWIRMKGFAFADGQRLTSSGRLPKAPIYTTKQGIIAYCRKDFVHQAIQPIHIDRRGKKYYLKDMLLVRHPSLSSGQSSAHWLASICTHSMLTTFLRYFQKFAEQYASTAMTVDFTSHHFRHTLNTLLDEGGLPDLLQTEWFGRTNPRDTKAYQHTDREKRALMLRADIKAGGVGGRLAEQIKIIPIHLQDAVLAARVQAVIDVGPGICVHNFVQTPCDRHLQCSAECDDYVWAKGDHGRVEELKRIYALTIVARETAERKSKDAKPKKSADWIVHNDKKLKTLSKQMEDYGIDLKAFDPHAYLESRNHD